MKNSKPALPIRAKTIRMIFSIRRTAAMKPILFNTPMVQAILNGTKTTTRRVVKPQFETDAEGRVHTFSEVVSGNHFVWVDRSNIKSAIPLPYHTGDVLYVRETFGFSKDKFHRRVYKADLEFPQGRPRETLENGKWKSPYAMPREAARLFLRVTGVRAERLQDITNAGALAEGCDGRGLGPSSGCDGSLSVAPYDFSVEKFETVWDSTVKRSDIDRYGWAANPWVWAISFERCEKEA
jgi:hypothetical protein